MGGNGFPRAGFPVSTRNVQTWDSVAVTQRAGCSVLGRDVVFAAPRDGQPHMTHQDYALRVMKVLRSMQSAKDALTTRFYTPTPNPAEEEVGAGATGWRE